MADYKEVDIKKAINALGELKKQDPRKESLSLRNTVEATYEDIQELLDQGWSRKQVGNHLRQTLGIEFSDITFSNYITQCQKKAQSERKRRFKRDQNEHTKKEQDENIKRANNTSIDINNTDGQI